MSAASSSPADWLRGAGLPDPAERVGPMPVLEREVRMMLRHYPLSWRQLHGEELVATTLEALDAQRFDGTRLPRRLRGDLRMAALRRRAAAWPTFWLYAWWIVTGLGFRHIDRWRARDLDLKPGIVWRWASMVLVGTFLYQVVYPFPYGSWPNDAIRLIIASVFVVVVAINVWHIVTGAPQVPRRTRAARLAAFGFTPGGVPYEWLPGWQAPPESGQEQHGVVS